MEQCQKWKNVKMEQTKKNVAYWYTYIIVGRSSLVGIATCYVLDGPGIESRWGARFNAPVQTGPGAHPGTVAFPGVKQPGRGVDHPLPSRAEVNERVDLYLYFPSAPAWQIIR
jgi:hypothetical protein